MSESESQRLASVLDMSGDMMEEIKATMPPELCSPAAAFLAHESCPLNGELLQIGMGSVSRLAVIHTQGISKDPLTAEDIADNLDAILDVSDARVTDSDAMVR
jgi:hypothetical protein